MQIKKDWKYYLGLMLFGASFLPYVTIFFIMPFWGLSAARYLIISSLLAMSAEAMFVLSVMFLGRTIVDVMKAAIKRVFKSAFSQQRPISYTRYVIGMIMFVSSMIYPTLSIEMILYFHEVSFVGQLNMMFILFSGDIMFIASFFVLGAGFITRLKSAFKYQQ